MTESTDLLRAGWRRALAGIAWPLAVLLLSACASGPRVVDVQVRTHSAQPPGDGVLNGARYRFEPGQAVVGQPAPTQLEGLAQTALARVGVLRDEQNPSVSVQVSGGVSAYWVDPWGPPYGVWGPRGGWGVGVGYGGRYGGVGWGMGDPDIPRYVSEVGLVMRDLRTGQIVYDSRARNDSAGYDNLSMLAGLFAATLQGYPRPPQGSYGVQVTLWPPGSMPAPPEGAPAAPGAPAVTPPAAIPVAPAAPAATPPAR